MALPGGYIVRLTVDGKHLEAPLTLKQDPRVGLPDTALEAQLALATRLAGLLTESSHAVLAAESEQAQLKALAPTGATAATVRAFAARLSALLQSEENDEASAAAVPEVLLKEVQENIAALYADVTRGDAAPTAAQLSATETAARELTGLQGSWQKLQADLAELNKRLRAAKLAPVRADLPPPRDRNVADEE